MLRIRFIAVSLFVLSLSCTALAQDRAHPQPLPGTELKGALRPGTRVETYYSAEASGTLEFTVTVSSVAELALKATDSNGQPAPHEQTPAYYDQTLGGRIYLAGLSTAKRPEAPVSTPASLASKPPEAERVMRPARPGSPGESCARKGNETYCVSSVLKPQFGNSYGPENLFEGPQSAAWVEGQAGQGIGEWITVEFESLRTVRSIVVRNGYQKSNDIFRKNNRVRQLRAVFSQGESQTLILPDRFGSELVTLPSPVKAYWVKFIIEDVWAGNKYTDTAITKLVVNSERVQ